METKQTTKKEIKRDRAGAFQTPDLPSSQPGIPPVEYALQPGKIFIKFPFDRRFTEIIKQAPDGRTFKRRFKCWEFPATLDNLRFLQEKTRIQGPDINKLINDLENPIKTGSTNWEFKTKPYAHQKTGFDLGTQNDAFFFMDDMGTGKTWMAIQIIDYRIRKGLAKKILILAPKTVLTTWESEFKKHSNLEPALIKGSKEKRERIMRESRICLMNYDLINSFNIFSEKGTLKGNRLIEFEFDMVILDESHYIKTMKAKRTKGIHKFIATIKYRILMTGTPITNGAEDIFSQYKALDDGSTFGPSFYAFRNRYFINTGFGNIQNWEVRPGCLDEIKKKMFSKARRVTKHECLDLPPKNYQRIDVDFTKDQERIYKELERKLYTEIEYQGTKQEIEIRFLMTKLMKLNQVTSGFVYQNIGKDQRRVGLPIPHHKIKILRELIEDKPKVVVWALFQYDLETLMREFQDMNPVRENRWQDFQENPDHRLLIGQVHSGGIGITLTAAEYVVYYSQGYSLTDRRQNEDRTHRAGTTGTVTYIDLAIPGTIEDDIIQALEKKRALSDYLTGDINQTKADYEFITEIYQNFRRKHGGTGPLKIKKGEVSDE